MNYANRNAVVLGLGLTGLSLARYLRRQGARVRVADTRAQPPNAALLAAALPGVPLLAGPFDDATFAGADLIAISPGVRRDHPAIAAAVARGAELVGDIELFARALPPDQKVLAITGSNGKTTVTALTGALCRAAGLDTVVAGNIGEAVLDALATRAAPAARTLARRVRAGAVELPARDDRVAASHRRHRAQRHRQPPRPLRRHRRLRGRQGAHLRAAAACRC